MTLIWVYTSIARRLGLEAGPCNWPSTILCVITHIGASGSLQPVNEADQVALADPLYLDFFHEGVTSKRSEMSALLSSHGLPYPIHHLHLDPVRCGKVASS